MELACPIQTIVPITLLEFRCEQNESAIVSESVSVRILFIHLSNVRAKIWQHDTHMPIMAYEKCIYELWSLSTFANTYIDLWRVSPFCIRNWSVIWKIRIIWISILDRIDIHGTNQHTFQYSSGTDQNTFGITSKIKFRVIGWLIDWWIDWMIESVLIFQCIME